ncbi:MAG: hypothetical protein ABL998_21060, partial [Planctomycetota bacterium]
QRVTQALGAQARHVVVPQAGHGVMALACMRDVLFRYVDAQTDDAALKSLIGRIDRTERVTSAVSLLTDPGCTLVALALVPGSDEPHILGRLTSLGRSAGGVRLLWSVRVPLELDGEGADVVARLFTGSGEPGLPGGLFLGEARLPRHAAAGEERELELTLTVDLADLRTLFVRREAPAEERP